MDDYGDVPGSRDVLSVLRTDPISRVIGVRLGTPIVLGIVIACLIAAMIVLGPASESRFIYTDF